MTPEQFVYWLQGFVELNPPGNLTGEQWKIITDHLKQVFDKKTPIYRTVDEEVPVPYIPQYPPIHPIDDPFNLYKMIC